MTSLPQQEASPLEGSASENPASAAVAVQLEMATQEEEYDQPLPLGSTRELQRRFAKAQIQYLTAPTRSAVEVLSTFQEQFENFTLDDFNALGTSTKSDLRDSLKAKGIPVRASRGLSKGRALMEVLDLDIFEDLDKKGPVPSPKRPVLPQGTSAPPPPHQENQTSVRNLSQEPTAREMEREPQPRETRFEESVHQESHGMAEPFGNQGSMEPRNSEQPQLRRPGHSTIPGWPAQYQGWESQQQYQPYQQHYRTEAISGLEPPQ